MPSPLRAAASNRAVIVLAAIVLVAVVAAAAILLLRGGGGEAETEAPQVQQAEEKFAGTIKIGASLSLTGRYSTEGTRTLAGALAVVEWINDNGGVEIGGKRYKLELIYYDDESQPDRVIAIVEKLIKEDGVKVLLAPYSSGLTAKAAPVAERYGVVMVSHGGASDKIFQQGYKYVVQVLTPASRYFQSTLDMIRKLDPDAKRLAIIYKESEFARTVAEGTREYAEKLGFEIVFFESYPADATDLTPILTKLKAAQPEIILGGGHFKDGVLLVKQMKEVGIKAKLIGILVAPAHPDFYKELGEIAETIVYPSQWEPSVKYSPENTPPGYEWYGPTIEEFVEYYNRVAAEVLGKPDLGLSYHAAEGGAAVLFIAKAIEEAQSLDPDRIRDAMNKIRIYTFFGKLQIDPETGLQIGHEMVVAQWQNGKRVVVWPEVVAEAAPVYPSPVWWED